MSDSRVAAGSILLMSLLGKDVITWNQKDNDNDYIIVMVIMMIMTLYSSGLNPSLLR